MQVNRFSSNCYSITPQFNGKDRVSENRIAYAALGALIIGTLYAGDPALLGSRFTNHLASIGYGAIGGIAGAIIGSFTEQDLLRSMVAATVYGCMGTAIGAFFGPATIIGYKPYVGPLLGMMAGVIVAEIEPKICTLANKIGLQWPKGPIPHSPMSLT